MSEQKIFRLSQAKIAIIGLGLMGGSLALALKGKCEAIYGIDVNAATRDLALRQNIVDLVDEDPAVLVPQADLVVLAVPVPAILTLLDQLPDFTPNPCIVLDLGSTKTAILKKMAALPERFDPVGGHPICGKERLSLENAERTLYYLAPFLLTPLARTTERAISACDQIISAIGSKKEILTAKEHDRILASTSHLPYLLSSAIALATPQDVSPYIGPGFKSTSRLAGTPSSMMLGVVMSNRENILSALERLQDELALFTSAIAENDIEVLNSSLVSAQEAYFHLMRTK
jgi:prephenate dehydrogenase